MAQKNHCDWLLIPRRLRAQAEQSLIAKQLTLLQEAHAIVPGEPKWTVQKFYDFYLAKARC